MNLLQATRDPNLFAPWFKRRETWTAWFAFIAALFALPMPLDQLALYKRCTNRETLPREQAKEAWLICGRRSGKSFILALIGVYYATFKDWRSHLTPGERATVLIIAADRMQARIILRFVRGLLHNIPMLHERIEREVVSSFDLKNNATIEIATASFRVTRGYACCAVVCDEAAFWQTSEERLHVDTEVINALRPALLTLPGSMLLVASTPYARRGALYQAYKRYYGKDGPILVWQAPTLVMNPLVSQAIIADAMEQDPARAMSEYGAEFRSDVESFVTRESIEACVALGQRERPPLSGTQYFAFCDPSGGTSDSFAIAIGHRQGDVAVIDVAREIKAKFSPQDVIDEFSRLLQRYGVTKVTGDRYAGEFPREGFRRNGITYELAEAPKSDIYRDALSSINSKLVELPDDPHLVNQFTSLERRTRSGGRDTIDHPPGPHFHDDLSNAVAGLITLLMARSAAYLRNFDLAYGDGHTEAAKAAWRRWQIMQHIARYG